jgi:hypothetical protein
MEPKESLSRPSYSVFVRFRRTRLVMRRGIRSLDGALEFAEALRRERFHQPERVIVVDDATGRPIEDVPQPSPSSQALPIHPTQTSPPVPLSLARPVVSPGALAKGAVPERGGAGGVRSAQGGSQSPQLARIQANLGRMTFALDAAERAQARCASLLEVAFGSSTDEGAARRARLLYEQSLGVAAGFRRVVELVEQQLANAGNDGDRLRAAS